MKQIISGKTYNTDTAEFVCDTSNSLRQSDYGHENSALYVTKKGAFFIAGLGGPLTRFKRDTGNGWSDGEGIIPLSRQEALAVAEEHASSDTIEEFFSDILEEA